MKHKINPIVDCVFKAILGSEENKNLLIHFLNAILEPEEGSRIQEVMIRNPYNEREFTSDKLTIVDVKAVDEKGVHYQIEIQLAIHAALSPRMLYTWSSIYHSQIQEGESFHKLRPVISIWLLDGNLFEDIPDYHIPFLLYNKKHDVVLSDHMSIHLLQLPKWESKEKITTEKERWMYLFKEGKNVDWDQPPDSLKTEEMRIVMNVLHRFSENQANYLLYQSRLEAVLKENTYLYELEVAKKGLEEARKEKEQERQKKEVAVKEKEQERQEKELAQEKLNKLLLSLKEKGIELDRL
jgi:predicted transposase/invertase (TIGR01784 family)